MHIDLHASALCVFNLQNASYNPHTILSVIQATRLQLSPQSKATITSPFCTQGYKNSISGRNSKMAGSVEVELGIKSVKWLVQGPHGALQRHWCRGWRIITNLIINMDVSMLTKSSHSYRNTLPLSQVTLKEECPFPHHCWFNFIWHQKLFKTHIMTNVFLVLFSNK